MQDLKSSEVAYFLFALFEKATLSRSSDNPVSRISEYVSKLKIYEILLIIF